MKLLVMLDSSHRSYDKAIFFTKRVVIIFKEFMLISLLPVEAWKGFLQRKPIYHSVSKILRQANEQQWAESFLQEKKFQFV